MRKYWSAIAGFVLVAGVILLTDSRFRASILPGEDGQSSSSASQASEPTYQQLTVEQLGNARYTLRSGDARAALMEAGMPFDVQLQNREYVFSGNRMYKRPFESIRLVPSSVVSGDLDGDGLHDAAAALELQSAARTWYELVIVRNDNGQPVHAASYPLTVSNVKGMYMTERGAVASIDVALAGDPSDSLRRSSVVLTLH